jgi:HK97 family phage portal protein
MSKRHTRQARSPTQQRSTNSLVWAGCSPDAFSRLVGYTKLSDNPEIQAAAQIVADMVSSMTIRLMENTKIGDNRIKNELSRKVDINPCKYITRKSWVEVIVKQMIFFGNSVHLPHYNGSLLDDIQPIARGQYQLMQDTPGGYGYYLQIAGQRFEYDEVLHFVLNPDLDRPWIGVGRENLLKVVAKQLGQARKTASSMMENPDPSIIVKIDSLQEEFASPEGRTKLLHQYVEQTNAGDPWMIPGTGVEVVTLNPINLNDLAIIDSINLDKRTAASIIGVPPFLVGVGKFDADEFNNFISSRVLPIARAIEQELTKKLLISPNWFFRFNPRSLYSYAINVLMEVGCNGVDRAILSINEVRDTLGYDPVDGGDERSVLENYIPYSKIGDQNKLIVKGGDDSGK